MLRFGIERIHIWRHNASRIMICLYVYKCAQQSSSVCPILFRFKYNVRQITVLLKSRLLIQFEWHNAGSGELYFMSFDYCTRTHTYFSWLMKSGSWIFSIFVAVSSLRSAFANIRRIQALFLPFPISIVYIFQLYISTPSLSLSFSPRSALKIDP